MATARVGVLGLQGDFAAHLEIFDALDLPARVIRRAGELDELDGLVVPGGESTTLSILLHANELYGPLRDFAGRGKLLGTCAGAILMARRIENPGGVEPLGILDMTVRRNGFGRQVDSFEDLLETSVELDGEGPPSGVFIRAPRITEVGEEVEVIASYHGEAVAVRRQGHMALTFHPEIRRDPRWHALWVKGLSPA